MQEGFSARETWPFECLHCLHVWQEEYLVRRQSDGHGNETVVWLRSEVPVQPPWAEAVCPECGDIRVKSFPAGYLAHHAELLPAPRKPGDAARPLDAVPAGRAAGDGIGGPQGRRVVTRFRLLAAVATAVILVLGLEFFEIAVAASR
ncbi:hypothetical protein HNP84_002739 [Thermocatellispora tengchongensis]|uniref:Uncharacterized protein n=1 Tax=Thermocatellispora tengchongensis TaxID=1073253 RepID=A0A840NZV7_9ACTN|nr:hypothetical protein [Thermocatellispora tengchongensis]MBB5133018.1 hypothetical protein [Thermocatellispora tengchongensis]